MNKTYLVIAAIFIPLGAAIAIFWLPKPFSFPALITKTQDTLTGVGTWIQNNVFQTFALVGGTASFITAALNGPYKQLKEAKATVEEQLGTTQTQMDSMRENYETKIRELQTQKGTEGLMAERDEAQRLVTLQQQQITDLKNQLDVAGKDIATKQLAMETMTSPTKEQMIRILTDKYDMTVKPKVA